jgi:very-short-patch-repair endonuclease
MGFHSNFSNVFAGWQTKLLQLDRRNSLLYFRANRSSVSIAGTSPDSLLDLLQRSRHGLKFPFAEQRRRTASQIEADGGHDDLVVPGDLKTEVPLVPLQRLLLNLHRRNREWEEEQGVHVLHVALGFLDWIDEEGEAARAPLLLVPVALDRDSPREPWRLKLEDDDLQTNETLRYQLSTLGLVLPEYEHETPSAYLNEITQHFSHKKGWAVAPILELATFPFAKMAMWEDLDEMRRKGTDHPVVLALAGDQGVLRPPRDIALTKLPEGDELSGGRLDDLLPLKSQFTVLPADHSQLRATELARRGVHLVIDGPPGTGKSQTIANIIGTLLADGKRVLFVSEKTAALDVVKKRLEECELGCFCLDLHSNRARKPSVYLQLREALDEPRTGAGSFPFEKLEQQRERLNTVARALHETRWPLGLSIFEIHGRFARVRSLTRVDFPVQRLDAISAGTLSDIQEATARIARRRGEFETHGTSPWRSLRSTGLSMELADDLRKAAKLMRNTLSQLQFEGGREAKALGLPPPESPSDLKVAMAIASHMAVCPGIPAPWLSQDALERLDRRISALMMMQSDRRLLEASLNPFLGSEIPHLDFAALKALLNISLVDEQRLRSALGAEWNQRLCPPPHSCANELERAIDCIRRLREAALLVTNTLLNEVLLDGLPQIRYAVQSVRAALETTAVPEPWFAPNGFSSSLAKLEHARNRLVSLEAAESQLFQDFDETLLQHVSHEMLVRFRTDYQSIWRFLRKSYRADQRTLRGCLRNARKLRVPEALAAVESALRIRDLREEWEVDSNACALAFESRYSGRNTDWEVLATAIKDIESRAQKWEWGLESAKRCFSSHQHRTAAEPLVRDLEVSLADWEANSLASQRATTDLGLSIRQESLESGVEIVSRLVRDGAPLWPALQGSLINWAQLVDILDKASQLRKNQAQETELAPALRKDLESYYNGPDSDWQRVQAASQWTHDLLRLAGGRVPTELATQCREPRSPEHYTEQVERLAFLIEEFKTRAIDFSELFDPRQAGWRDWESPTFERLISWLAWVEQNADSASSWLEYINAVRDLERLLAPGAVDALRNATDDASLVPDLVLRRIYAGWIDYITNNDARLRFEPRDHEHRRAEFQQLDKRFLAANRERIREHCFRRYPDDNGSAIEWGQLGTLNRQLSLKRRQMPVRHLIQHIPQVLQVLKPCFLMSPVAVSQYLSRGDLATDSLGFDAVIFDEASQIFPHDAVPAIARAKQVIVVGDEKQLPPSSFFRSDVSDNEDDESEVTEDRLEGVESILNAMIGMTGSGVQRTQLGIHYRSRHEDLIRYSNHHFYRDRLLTFPSPDLTASNLGLKDVFLPEARYDAGASRTNRLEAEATVLHVFGLLRSCPTTESVGVVTLSRSQATLVEELINERRTSDSSLESRFGEDLPERFFVKNLENVQGDERDHIILSIGYGPTVGSGSVPNRFGPINRAGGERRLNVAVTRARRSLTVIRSLRPEQITSEAEGARLLRRFLEYAKDPSRAFEQLITLNQAAEAESPFEDAVYHSLVERGHRVEKQVGCFGYRIDLAIASEDGSAFDLGIECDGATYHRTPAARDRDWLRQRVLEGLGWTIHRIWSTDWIRDPQAQIRAVEHALGLARNKLRQADVQDIRVFPQTFSGSDKTDHPNGSHKDEGWLSRSAEEFRFAPYKPMFLPESRSRAFLDDESPQKLRELIVRVVEAEGPVHIDVVIDRIRRHYGASRAGHQIQGTIIKAVNSASSENGVSWCKFETGGRAQQTSFLDLGIHSSRPEPRGPSEDGFVRPIEHVWPGEIESGLIRVVEIAFGISQEDAIVAVARAFGYARVGRKIREAISGAIDRLISAREIIVTPNGLRRRNTS